MFQEAKYFIKFVFLKHLKPQLKCPEGAESFHTGTVKTEQPLQNEIR